MNSIFSSFDAVCFEFLSQKLKSSLPSGNKMESQQSKEKMGNPSPPASVGKPRKERVPRFAPELDGLHCFETLVSF
ncbi:hypothetical protein PVL29_001748 [Vitis rotundifolia]|uniref:Uncharacterized protein n=1 Tax=Vitis rotundifolia TaxID=103349 RepID=A0AA39AG23_VITRO|nr:hypothetical protein PVL29_001748 [Vitis rotundifolia]